MTGLPKQKVVINLGQGIDTKTDPRLVMPGKLIKLINGVFKKRGRIDKRNGFDLISNETLDGSELTDGSALQVFNSELLQYNKQSLYSYSKGAGKWINKGAVVSASLETGQIVKNTASQTQADFAYNSGISVYAYEDSRGGVRATVYDESTGTAMLADTVLDASASRVRCLAFGFYLYVFYYKSGGLYVRRINPQLPTSFDAAVQIASDVNTTNPNYDVLSFQSLRIMFVYNVQGSTATTIAWLDDAPSVLAGALAPQQIAEASTNCLSVFLGPSNLFYVLYHNGSGLRVSIRNNGGNQIVAPTTVDSYTGTAIRNVTGYPARDNSGVTVFYEVTAASAGNQFVKKNTISTLGVVGSPTVWMRSVGLFSKAFKFNFSSESVDHGYVAVTHDSTLQSTYFIARDDGVIIGKMQYTLGSGLTTRTILAQVAMLDDNTFAFALLNKFQLISQDGTVFSLQGVSQTRIDFDALEQFNGLQLGNNLHIVGGVLNMYDGQSVVEHGFHLYPEGFSTSLSGAAGLGDGTYKYVGLYEWTDNYGQIHRSAPSVPFEVTVTGGPRQVDVVFPTLRLTQKTGGRSDVVLVLYRTEDGPGDIYYRTTPITSPTYNNPMVDSITIADTTSDATLISNEILYSTGGVLENFAAPACKVIEQFKDRIFLSGLENPNEIWYSKAHGAGEAVEFSDVLTLDVASEGGGIKAMATLDDKEIIFKKDRFFFTYGDGPNNAGTGGEFAKPQFVTADVGCDNPVSIVRTPNGIMFKSGKGIYLLDSSLNVSYIGAEVEEFNGEEITSATLAAETNQVRFTTRTGPLIAYDYFFKQWSTFHPYSAFDSVIYDKAFVFLGKDGNVYQETTGYRDAGKGISLSMLTGWLSFDSLIGFQRVYELLIEGEFRSYHKLKISVGYDYSETFETVYVMDTDEALEIGVFGQDTPFGNQSPFGGKSRAYRFTIGMDVQKCSAIRFQIEDLTVSSTPGTGEGYNITALGLIVGIKGQSAKYQRQQVIPSR